MRTVKSIIDELGGTTEVAEAHRPPIPVSTVDSWVRSNYIPDWRRPEIKRIAKRRRKVLTDNDFPPKDLRLRSVG